jgi:DNA-directed RNA polymerase specialized sigma24 family protein
MSNRGVRTSQHEPPVSSGSAADEVDLVRSALDDAPGGMPRLVMYLLPLVRKRVRRALLRRRARLGIGMIDHVCDDLVQDTLVALLDRRSRVLRGWCQERGSLRGFVGVVAERQVGMVLRSPRRSPFTELATDCDELERAQSRSEAFTAVSEAANAESRNSLRVLSELLREHLSERGYFVFEVLFLEQSSTERALERTGLSRDALYAWRCRIVRQAQMLGLRPATRLCGRSKRSRAYDTIMEPSLETSWL